MFGSEIIDEARKHAKEYARTLDKLQKTLEETNRRLTDQNDLLRELIKLQSQNVATKD